MRRVGRNNHGLLPSTLKYIRKPQWEILTGGHVKNFIIPFSWGLKSWRLDFWLHFSAEVSNMGKRPREVVSCKNILKTFKTKDLNLLRFNKDQMSRSFSGLTSSTLYMYMYITLIYYILPGVWSRICVFACCRSSSCWGRNGL